MAEKMTSIKQWYSPYDLTFPVIVTILQTEGIYYHNKIVWVVHLGLYTVNS